MISYISNTVHNLSFYITIGLILLVKLVYQFALFFSYPHILSYVKLI
jgi:hypothetical protein